MVIRFEKPIPVREFRFPEPGPTMFELRCPEHTWVRYLTKGPARSLHYCPAPEDFFKQECTCPISKLEVIGKE